MLRLPCKNRLDVCLGQMTTQLQFRTGYKVTARRFGLSVSVTRKKLPNIYKSYPKLISLENDRF